MKYVNEVRPFGAGSPCCGGQGNAIYYNPDNQVVQCHNCGHVYEPKPLLAESEADTLEPLARASEPTRYE